jgi:hypothetical protein
MSDQRHEPRRTRCGYVIRSEQSIPGILEFTASRSISCVFEQGYSGLERSEYRPLIDTPRTNKTCQAISESSLILVNKASNLKCLFNSFTILLNLEGVKCGMRLRALATSETMTHSWTRL